MKTLISVKPATRAAEIGFRDFPHAALALDTSVSHRVNDISYEEASSWVMSELTKVDYNDVEAMKERVKASTLLTENLEAFSRWPIATHAHLQVIHQLSKVIDDLNFSINHDDGDMTCDTASVWAEEEVMKVDLSNPFMIADRIGTAITELEKQDLTADFPGLAFGHRKVVADLSVFLNKTRGVLH